MAREHDEVVDAFVRLLRALVPLLAETWVETQLTMAQLKALCLLHARGRASGRELAQALGVGPSAVSQVVDRLVADGYVQRDEDPLDRRVTWLTPTARGRQAIEQILLSRREAVAGVFATIPAEALAKHQVADALALLAETTEQLTPPFARPAAVALVPATAGERPD